MAVDVARAEGATAWATGPGALRRLAPVNLTVRAWLPTRRWVRGAFGILDPARSASSARR